MRRVRGWSRWVGAGVLGAGLFSRCAVGQGTAARVDAGSAASVGDVLRGLASRAGVVFVGRVQRIEAKDGVMEITFLVERPVAGVAAGTYVEREWAGRWVGGQQRYRVGQRAMFFLHAPNAAGLSSPVDGMAGVVGMVPAGGDGMSLLDVRLLTTRLVRKVGSPLVDAEFGGVSQAEAETVVRKWAVGQKVEPVRRVLPEGVVTKAGGSSLRGPEEMPDAHR